MNIVCIGSGYVGTVTACAFASLGHHTTVIDIDKRKVDMINQGKSPVYEPFLNMLLAKSIPEYLQASVAFDAVKRADLVFICVGTPAGEDGSADLSFIRSAAESLAANLDPGRFTVIATKSTVPVGTGELVSSIVGRVSGLKEGTHFAIAGNPEFLREGRAVEDVFFPDRIVVGTKDTRAGELLRTAYRPFVSRSYPSFIMELFEGKSRETVYFETDPKSAELIKYVSNAYLAVKVSYINEVARLCDALGANVADVSRGMGLDARIGEQFLQVSPGWGGSCFPKDTQELLASSVRCGRPMEIVKAAIDSNERMRQYCVEKLKSKLGALNGKMIGILGLTFKPGTDDVRMSQSFSIISQLQEAGAQVSVHDPLGMEPFRKSYGQLPVVYCHDAEAAAAGADALVLVTHWDMYRSLNWSALRESMNRAYVLDTRNFLDGEKLRALGFEYEGVGIP
ncbi:UDP-glucose dehydrogenase family protein [Paenibacillus thermotolerans]|uniref:UDP-glucose dehydrogenase family protein n=1 Tax=Paenibacillus thermotolerans TaxID=3027807 RepID=UPI0023684315|nr:MULTISPECIES: UDP-glucose/GDP-mannose dehydrogenase family protein [unclassified Paenibacillus]